MLYIVVWLFSVVMLVVLLCLFMLMWYMLGELIISVMFGVLIL